MIAVLCVFNIRKQLHQRFRPVELSGGELTSDPRPRSTSREVVAPHLLSFSFGCIWAAAPILFAPAMGEAQGLSFILLMATALVFGALWLCFAPSMLIAYTVPFVVGAAVAIATMSHDFASQQALLSILLMGSIVIGTGLFASWINLQQLNRQMELRDQISTANMLLEQLQSDTTSLIWEVDPQGHVERFPHEMLNLKPIANGQKISSYLHEVVIAKDGHLEELKMAQHSRTAFSDLELCIKTNIGERWVRIKGQPKFADDGAFAGFAGTVSDTTIEKLAEDRINTLTQSDTLTGLMNRSAFSTRLEQAVANLERYGRPFTVLHLDLDNFKLINDTRGHVFGDRLLAEASERIEDEVREVDCLARLSGDEFAILMDGQGDAGAAARLAARLIGEVTKPYKFENEELRVGLSIGIALAPLNGTRPDQLLRNADLALYRAKADGRGVFRFFESNMDSELRERRMLEAELKNAVKNNELVLHYQPLVDAQTHQCMGMESLIRWQHPIRGLLPPGEFIEIAEHGQMISELGDWTLETACRAALDWPEHMFVAVNLSAHHFMQATIVEQVQAVLERTGLAPERLELELTESMLIHNTDEVVVKIEQLKSLGVSVAMDDFGTGYSSLSYLTNVPFDKLKIDKSFIDEIGVKASGKSIVCMISSLAKELGLKVTAEGVETQEQSEFLGTTGCDLLQGYHFARPLNSEQLALYLLNETRRKLNVKNAEKKRRKANSK